MQRPGFEQLIVILGCPRSGTTWLHGMLADHPEVAGLSETYLFTDYVQALHDAYGPPRRAHVGLDKVLGPDGFRDCLRRFAQAALDGAAQQHPGARILVEKTPGNALVWRGIRELFPDAWLVHVLRDPRDVVSSLKAAGRSWGRSWAPSGTAGAVLLWRRFVESAAGVEDDPRGLVVRYERLLEDGAGELARVGEAIGLAARPDWYRDVVARHAFEGRARAEGAGPGRFLRRGQAGGWREDLSRRDVRVVEYVAGALMDQLGYPRSVLPPPRKPLGLAAHDLLRRGGRAWRLRAHRLFRRSLGLPDP